MAASSGAELAGHGRSIFFSESSPNIGGQELQLLFQADALRRHGWVPRVLCRPGSRIAEEAAARGLPVELLRFRGALDLGSIRGVIGLARRWQPVAVVCHSGHDANICALAVRAGAALGLLRPRPRLVRMRTYQPGKAGAFGYNHLFDASFTPSAALRAQLLANPKIKPGRIGVLYPAIDFERLRSRADDPLPPAVQQRLEAAGTGPVLAHAAMLRAEKGHGFMLEVVRALAPRHPGLLYVLAGEGPLREELARKAQDLGIARHVLFAGMLPSAAPLIRRADVLVMPSLYEPLGMSQVEALALGVPVVVSNVGGLPETVQEGVTGRICPAPSAAGAVDAWAGALAATLGDAEAARAMAARGAQAVQQQFDTTANLAALARTWA